MELSPHDLIESLDTLWFFSNPLAPTSPIAQPVVPPSSSDKNTQTPLVDEPLKCSICGGEEKPDEEPQALSVQVQVVQPLIGIPYFLAGPEPEERIETSNLRRKKTRVSYRRRRRRRRSSKRSILAEIDLDLEDCGWMVGSEEEEEDDDDEKGNRSGPHYSEVKLPPLDNLDDAMAMKEHLKSWAYAVACTVR